MVIHGAKRLYAAKLPPNLEARSQKIYALVQHCCDLCALCGEIGFHPRKSAL